MGDWCDYEIKPANGTTNLTKELVDRGLANVVYSEDRQSKSLSINIKEIAPDYYKNINADKLKDDEIDWIKIGLHDDGSLYYVYKWGPNDALLDGISRILPDVVLQVTRDFEWYESVHWWEKMESFARKQASL